MTAQKIIFIDKKSNIDILLTSRSVSLNVGSVLGSKLLSVSLLGWLVLLLLLPLPLLSSWKPPGAGIEPTSSCFISFCPTFTLTEDWESEECKMMNVMKNSRTNNRGPTKGEALISHSYILSGADPCPPLESTHVFSYLSQPIFSVSKEKQRSALAFFARDCSSYTVVEYRIIILLILRNICWIAVSKICMDFCRQHLVFSFLANAPRNVNNEWQNRF